MSPSVLEEFALLLTTAKFSETKLGPWKRGSLSGGPLWAMGALGEGSGDVGQLYGCVTNPSFCP